MIIKVCGMRDPENMAGVQQVPGVAWMGMIFHPASPRSFNREELPATLRDLTPQKVGVFVDQPLAAVRATARNFTLDRLQLHGSESPAYCQELAEEWPLIKAFRVGERENARDDFNKNQSMDWTQVEPYHAICTHFLFDTAGPQPGGNGQTFDWSLLHDYQGPTPFLLAGGIGPAHLDQLSVFQHPYWAGIDLNSGFEIRPGLKDLERIELFVQALTANLRSMPTHTL